MDHQTGSPMNQFTADPDDPRDIIPNFCAIGLMLRTIFVRPLLGAVVNVTRLSLCWKSSTVLALL
jgi:hypothetical protein